ncbi:hypothetical protein CHU98_g12403, partial [Xylaria longipes]
SRRMPWEPCQRKTDYQTVRAALFAKEGAPYYRHGHYAQHNTRAMPGGFLKEAERLLDRYLGTLVPWRSPAKRGAGVGRKSPGPTLEVRTLILKLVVYPSGRFRSGAEDDHVINDDAASVDSCFELAVGGEPRRLFRLTWKAVTGALPRPEQFA